MMKKPIAWDVYEWRVYGAPGEKRHRVLWTEDYALPDGNHPDLDCLLESAATSSDATAKTIHVRPMFYESPDQTRADERERLAKLLEQRVRWVACDCGCEREKIADQDSGVWLRAAMLVRDGMLDTNQTVEYKGTTQQMR